MNLNAGKAVIQRGMEVEPIVQQPVAQFPQPTQTFG